MFFNKKEMFKATCSECGNKCEVPFKPTEGKPVLCSTCFEKQKSKDQGRPDRRDFGRGDRKMFVAVCNKCGGRAEVPFRPTEGKPVYCNNCFSQEGRRGDRRDDRRRDRYSNMPRDTVGNRQLSDQLKSVSNKLDKVISILEGTVPKKKSETLKPEPKEKAKKTAVKKSVKKAAKKKK